MFLLLSLLMGFPAHALIIYLDTNNNPQEREIYQKTLNENHPGETFVSIPAQDPQSSLTLKNLTKKRDSIFNHYTKKGCSAQLVCNPIPLGECGEIHARLKLSEQAVAEAAKTPLNAQTLREGLREIQLNKGEQVTVSVSGHYELGNFTGNLGTLSVVDIQSAFEDFPKLRARVSQLHLLGCYTNTLAQVKDVWRKAFPRARVLVGFHGQSPVGENPSNLRFIKDITINLYNYSRIETPEEFSQATGQLFAPHEKITPALVVGDYFQTAGAPMVKISEGKVRTKTCLEVLPPENIDYFKDIMMGNKPVPMSTGSSALRSYYTNLQRFSGCLEEPGFLEKGVPPAQRQVIRLILYRTVVKNFVDQHLPDLANFDQYLQSVGIPAELSIKNLDMSDRKALHVWHDQIQQNLRDLKADKAEGLLHNFSKILIDLSPECIPPSWIEPGPIKRSTCFEVKGMCSGT